MKTALHLSPCLAWKRSWALLESSNFDAQPTLSYQRLLMHIYSAISNNPTFSNLSVFVTPSCTTVFIHLSELCSQMQEAYILNHISLQQLLICSSANSLWKNERFEVIVPSPLAQSNSHCWGSSNDRLGWNTLKMLFQQRETCCK